MSEITLRKTLAAILKKAQGVVDAEAHKVIDIGGEVQSLNNLFESHLSTITALRERVAELEAEIAKRRRFPFDSAIDDVQLELLQELHSVTKLTGKGRHECILMAVANLKSKYRSPSPPKERR